MCYMIIFQHILHTEIKLYKSLLASTNHYSFGHRTPVSKNHHYRLYCGHYINI